MENQASALDLGIQVGDRKYLTFNLGDESYGIEVLKIQEIITMMKVTPLPESPHYVKGIINLRGKVIPVIDMRLKLGIGLDEITEFTCIIVVQYKEHEGRILNVGLIVDKVEEVTHISASQVEEVPEVGFSSASSYVCGIAKTNNNIKALLNIDALIRPGDVQF